MLENCIFYIFQMYEFSHSQDPERTTFALVHKCPRRELPVGGFTTDMGEEMKSYGTLWSISGRRTTLS